MKPLEGLRILTVEHFGAGPYGTMFLAGMGAEVIKIENAAAGGDPARRVGPHLLGDDDSQYFQSWNLGKKSIALDLKNERERFETLVAGEVQFGQMTGALMFSARLQGADPLMLAGVQDFLNDRLIVRPGINSVEDLKGKRIGVFRFGSASHMRLLNVLPRYGMSERDVTFLQVGDTPERLIALHGGSIDATLLSPPDHFLALRGGIKIISRRQRPVVTRRR